MTEYLTVLAFVVLVVACEWHVRADHARLLEEDNEKLRAELRRKNDAETIPPHALARLHAAGDQLRANHEENKQ